MIALTGTTPSHNGRRVAQPELETSQRTATEMTKVKPVDIIAMVQLLITGDWAGAFESLAPLYGAGYRLTLTTGERTCDCPLPQAPALTVLALGPETPLPARGLLSSREQPWICWNRSDDPARDLAAYHAGALTVLPADATASVLLQSVCNALAALAPAPLAGEGERRYTREELITLPSEAILEVRAGVVAQTVIHADGSEVLLGLCGPGQILTGHPEDSCCLQLVAHTDAVVSVRRWEEATTHPAFVERLRARLRQMEAWSAMGARHYLDQRVVGVLDLLAEQFGAPQGDMIVIDVRITHAQLAAAVGATRTTVTRILGDLRTRGHLTTVGSGANERFCLHTLAGNDHGLR